MINPKSTGRQTEGSSHVLDHKSSGSGLLRVLRRANDQGTPPSCYSRVSTYSCCTVPNRSCKNIHSTRSGLARVESWGTLTRFRRSISLRGMLFVFSPIQHCCGMVSSSLSRGRGYSTGNLVKVAGTAARTYNLLLENRTWSSLRASKLPRELF